MKIDIVFTWVDGSDPAWNQKKNNKAKQVGAILPAANNSARYMDNDELKYSLRSIEKYASWVNQIFIITDDQIPDWLNTENPKINVVDLTDIIEDKFLPIFNSCAIENHIHKIKNLSEYFIYFNDDMFLGNFTTQEHFFTTRGKPRVFVSEWIPIPNKKLFDIKLREPEKRNIYQHTVINARKIIFKKFGKKTFRNFRHGIKPFLKSQLNELENIFKDEILETNKNSFRTNEDVLLTYLFEFYAIVEKIGKAKYLMTSDTNKFLHKIINKFYKQYTFGFINLHEDDTKNHLERIFENKPFTFCLNQTSETPVENLKYLKSFLEKYFPHKSQFEK